MTFEELSNDHSFIQGLKNGEFCLVIGAGFSCDLRNKITDSLPVLEGVDLSVFNTIPLVKEYVELTNAIFTPLVTKGQAAANNWEHHNFSKMKNGSTIDLRELYKNLFTLDEDWFIENALDTYKAILIPDWYQVYTFNFDNVFETITQLEGRSKYYSLHFPEDKGDNKRRTGDQPIHHLHGFVHKTPPENLTFSEETYEFLEESPHTLYDPLHVDIASGKKLVIIGNQFDEHIIDTKFFKGLKEKNITVYHFSQNNENFETKSGIRNNPNYHFVQIDSTKEVLDFFEKHRSKIEKIDISGADVIDAGFIEKVKKEGESKGFKPSDYYLAKQSDECQWYGIAKNWDIETDFYQKIKNEVTQSLYDESRLLKISALVWGKGGSGKSTLLRKLAFDLSEEDFSVLWIIDKEIDWFYESGISELRKYYPHRIFLIVLEDLYRVKQQDIPFKEVIDSICQLQNVRLIVGDRRNDDNNYHEHVYNPNQNTFELKVDENKKTLEKLLLNIPEWKVAAHQLLTSTDDYKSTLYYILWTLGRTANQDLADPAFTRPTGLSSHFRKLVQSDLKALSVHYPGVAKMLYYWGSIYSQHKLYIGYDLFFKLADLFLTPLDKESKSIHDSPFHKSLLDIYVYKAVGFVKSAGGLAVMAFNQDILAEDGLNKAKLTSWLPISDRVKMVMLSTIINDGDDYSSGIFLSHCLGNLEESLFPNAKKKLLTDKLRARGSFSGYLKYGFKLNFYSNQEKIDLANDILSQDKFWELDYQIVTTALTFTRDKAKADQVLSQDNFWVFPYQIIITALKILKNKDKANEILDLNKFWLLPTQMVVKAFKLSKNKQKAAKFLNQSKFWKLNEQITIVALKITKDIDKADEILKQVKFWELDASVVCTALYISNDKKKSKDVLDQNDFWQLTPSIVSTALNITRDSDKANEFLAQDSFWEFPTEIVVPALNISENRKKASEILKQKDFLERFPSDIISSALSISKDKIKANDVLIHDNFWSLPTKVVVTALKVSENIDKANDVLNQKNFWGRLPHQVVCIALSMSKNKFYADKILEQEKFWEIQDVIVASALIISENEKLIEKAGELFFESDEWRKKWKITYHLLYFFAKRKKTPKRLIKICTWVISEYQDGNNRDKAKYFRYVNLMKIPLHTVDYWKKHSLQNIREWKRRNRGIVTNTILAYRSNPMSVKNMCEEILNDWRFELSRPIYHYNKRAEICSGHHIGWSLGHPNLRSLALKIAKEISELEIASPGTLHDFLMTVVKRIVDQHVFPDWEV